MAVDLLQQVREEIDDRMVPLAAAVTESRRLTEALLALEGLGAAAELKSPAVTTTTGNGDVGGRAVRGPAEAGRSKARRASRGRGSSDRLVLEAVQSQSGVLDIKTVAKRTGLSQHAASYNLKKLAAAGVLTQSALSGSRGMPKLMFGLAEARNGSAAEVDGSARGTRTTAVEAAAKGNRNARKTARRGTTRVAQ